VVRDGKFMYYTTEEEAREDKNRKGSIPLKDANMTVFDPSTFERNWCFGVTPAKSNRTYVMECADSEERLDWIRHLRQFGAQIKASVVSTLMMNAKREEQKVASLNEKKAHSQSVANMAEAKLHHPSISS